MILVTGGAGFIGSHLVTKLGNMGHDVVVCDTLGSDRWKNLRSACVRDIIEPRRLYADLDYYRFDAVFHLGAVTNTLANGADGVTEFNFRASSRLLDFCIDTATPLIYASSAATYGKGEHGFDDAVGRLHLLRPLSLYAWSKHIFDRMVSKRMSAGILGHVIGLKFFNVYGTNEDHKGHMASMVSRLLKHRLDKNIDADGKPFVNLFRSYREDIKDGEQVRDFVHVDDVVEVLIWAWQDMPVSSIYNVGTGQPRTFNELVHAVFAAREEEVCVQYTAMPWPDDSEYQYFTCAKLERLRAAGYEAPFLSLEEGIMRCLSGNT